MIVSNKLRPAMLACFIALAGAGATIAAATIQRECPNPSKEDRQKMAAAHEQMAACLRSDKSVVECRTDLAKSQRQMMQMMGCPGGKMHPHQGPKSQTNPSEKG